MNDLKLNKNYILYKLIWKMSFSNTFVTLTNAQGDVLYNASSGSIGFKGSKRASSYAVEVLCSNVIKYCNSQRISNILLYFNGVGKGRKISSKILKGSNLNILYINDVTSLPFNGCKLPAKRRV